MISNYLQAGLCPIKVWGTRGMACQCAEGNQCGPKAGKHPVRNGWQNGNPDEFENWHGNVGLAVQAGYVVVDVDGAIGEESIARYTIPRTWTARSGRAGGGRHLWFRLSADQTGLRNWTRAQDGIDLRVTGGQVVAPPSVHQSGAVYTWEVAPWDAPCAPLQPELYDLFLARNLPARVTPPISRGAALPADKRVEACRRYVAKMDAAHSGAGGHTATFKAARVICKDFELSESEAWSVLCEYNERCSPPWSESELRHKLRDAMDARVAVAKGIERHRPSWAAMDVNATAVIVRDWKNDLKFSQNKRGDFLLIPNELNACILLRNAQAFEGRIKYNEFTGVNELHGVDFGPLYGGVRTGPIEDGDFARIVVLLQQCRGSEAGGGAFKGEVVARALEIVAKSQSYHPIRDQILSYRWDGQERAATWLIRYAGAEDTPHNRTIAWKFLVSAVRRVLDPGCQVDTTLILEGGQGVGKTSLIAALFGAEYVHASRIDIGSKDGAIALGGKWCVEFAELEAFKGRDSALLKAWLTVRQDSYRPPYGRNSITVKRQCVFVGSTNDSEYLDDPTGSRRFWPVKVGDLDLASLIHDHDQIWAEAVELAHAGKPHWLLAAEQAIAAEVAAERHVTSDSWIDLIAQWLKTGRSVTTREVLEQCLQIEPGKQARLDTMRAAAALRAIGCERKKLRINGHPTWSFCRI